MKSRWNILRRSRTFIALVVLSLPLLLGGCPLSYPLSCDDNVIFELEKGKCMLLTSPCGISGSWEEGDSFRLDFNIGPFGTFTTTPDIYIDERTSRTGAPRRTTTLRRLCSTPFVSTLTLVGGTYHYSTGILAEENNFYLTVYDEGLLTVHPKVECPECPYITPGTQLKVNAYTSGGSPPYISYVFTANGVPIPPISTNSPAILHNPIRNTEYKVTVTDSAGHNATNTVVVKVPTAANQPVADTNAPTFTTVNSPITINPSSSTGNIVRWQWDTDWRGDDGEPFETTIEGSNGSIAVTWTTTGTKYVRLRVTDALGNFNECFVAVYVQSSAVFRSENTATQ